VPCRDGPGCGSPGQWGTALAIAGALFGLEVKVYMVRAGAVLAETPDNPGSLGLAISEAVEDAATRDDTEYALGSVLNHVLLHQTVIGQEAILQMEMAGEKPDILIGCTGGGSSFAGLVFPFLGQKLRGEADYRPAPESSHAIRAAIDEALLAKEEGVARVILFNLSGHGHFDLSACERYLAGALVDYEYPAAMVARALAALPSVG
jgi:predicted alternative tryptophan synthase beta-subunit